jgi:hypothetical protein
MIMIMASYSDMSFWYIDGYLFLNNSSQVSFVLYSTVPPFYKINNQKVSAVTKHMIGGVR